MQVGVTAGTISLKKTIETLGSKIDQLLLSIDKLAELKVVNVDNCQEYIQITRELRTAVDALEKLVDDHEWPLPKYREMLFVL